MDVIMVRMRTPNVLVVMYVLTSVCCELCQNNCHTTRVKGLKTVDCYRMEITRVPQCLSRSAQILDLSINRIREIGEEDLKPYSYLEILYLTDNILTEIDEHALDDLTSLHTLDVSMNAFYKIPKGLFSLPALRKLLLADIKNRQMVEDIEEAVPITSPLVYLDLSRNRLERLPMLGELPSLQYYNVSGNKNVQMNTSMFAGLCNLQEFIDVDFSPAFKSPCDCVLLEQWLTRRSVKFKSFNCPHIECTNEIPAIDLDIFDSCKKLYEAQQQQMYTNKLLTNVGIAMGILALALVVLLYFILKRRRTRKQKKKAEREAQMKQRKEVIGDML